MYIYLFIYVCMCNMYMYMNTYTYVFISYLFIFIYVYIYTAWKFGQLRKPEIIPTQSNCKPVVPHVLASFANGATYIYIPVNVHRRAYKAEVAKGILTGANQGSPEIKGRRYN